MSSLINDAFAQSLAKECFWKLLSTMGTHFSEEDFALSLMNQIGGSKIIHSSDGIYVICEYERYRTTVQTIRHPHAVKHDLLHYSLPLNDGIELHNAEHNSRDNLFDEKNVHGIKENELGTMILKTWNARFAEGRKQFSTTREVVLIKGEDLSEISLYEDEIPMFLPEEYEWEWNQKGNLEGYLKGTDVKKFTWQPHGSQFTITTNVPENRLKLRIKRPPLLDREEVLTQLKFDPSWIEIVK